MANVKAAIHYVLRLEDPDLSGEVTCSPFDRGGRTRFGIAERSHPEMAAKGFYEADRETALAMAVECYDEEYATPLRIALISDQPVATAVLSFAINAGPGTAAKAFQSAVCMAGTSVDVDGHIGPKTIAAANALDPTALLRAFMVQQQTHYLGIVAKDETQGKWLNGWLNRAAKPLVDAYEIRQEVAA